MPEGKSALDDFLGSVKDPQVEDPFQEESENPFPEDKEPLEVEEDKKVDFHKDPKIQRYIDKQIAKRLAEKPEAPAPREVKETKDEEIALPESFVQLIGNDTFEKKQVLKDLSHYFDSLKGEARNEFLKEMEQREEQSSRADSQAISELEEGFEAIEDQFGVDADTPEFRAFIKRVAPKDSDGNVSGFPDLVSTYETYQELKKPDNSRAKQLASRGMARSSDASKEPVSQDRSWKGVDKMLSKLIG